MCPSLPDCSYFMLELFPIIHCYTEGFYNIYCFLLFLSFLPFAKSNTTQIKKYMNPRLAHYIPKC